MRGATILATLVVSAAALAGPNDPVAIVNGEAISRADLDAVMAQRPPIVTPLSASQIRLIHREVVASLVDELLVRQFLRKAAPPVENGKVAEQLQALTKGLAAQKKSLADYLKETQQSEAQLKASIATVTQWNAWASSQMTETVMRQFYTDNKDFFDKTTVRASHIVIRTSPGDEVGRRAAEGKLTALRAEIAAGKVTFAEAARAHSQCPSAPKGGDLGYFARKWMVEEPFAKAAFALKPGELSSAVVTDFGVHLIQVADRKVGAASSFELVKDDVRECLLEELRQTTLTNLRKSAKVEIKLP